MAANHSKGDLSGENEVYQQAVERIQHEYGFGFVSLGLTAFPGAPLKWIYGAGATSDRYKRIALSPGQGIGGIVVKSGKPLMFLNIDKQLDPREYSSYPIVFAEDLHSFCCLPLFKKERVVGALLCADRTIDLKNEERYLALIADLNERLLDFDVRSTDFLHHDTIFAEKKFVSQRTPSPFSFSPIITAQEEERRRISRELHDGITQELLSVSFLVRQLREKNFDTSCDALFDNINTKIDIIMDELHNLSVELRPSTLDSLGLVPALKSRALVFEKTYGAAIEIADNLSQKRFHRIFETQVYRICQEAILNACKYSGSDTILVHLEDAEDRLYATITDRGQGFDVAQPEIKGSGCGLSGIHERASLIGATLVVSSGTTGTKIELTAPFVLEEKD